MFFTSASSNLFGGVFDILDVLGIIGMTIVSFKIHRFRPSQLQSNGTFFSKAMVGIETFFFEKILRFDDKHEEKALSRAIWYWVISFLLVMLLKVWWFFLYALLLNMSGFGVVGLLFLLPVMALVVFNIAYSLHILVPLVVKGIEFVEWGKNRVATRINDGSTK